jgi:hypothetical protein
LIIEFVLNDLINSSIFKIKIRQYQPTLTDVQLFAAPGEEDETDLDGTTEIATREKSAIVQTGSDFSMMSSSSTRKKHLSRSYKFIQLERALTSANLIQNNDDRLKFENEYLQSIDENTFDEFLHNYYKKIREHCERIQQERALKKARIFTFFDLEKNFLALDPTRDVKIVFIDESTASSISKTTYVNKLNFSHRFLILLDILVRTYRPISNPHHLFYQLILLQKRFMLIDLIFFFVIQLVHVRK